MIDSLLIGLGLVAFVGLICWLCSAPYRYTESHLAVRIPERQQKLNRKIHEQERSATRDY